RRAVGMAGVALLAALAGSTAMAAPARAETGERTVRGRVITLVTVGDDRAMTSLAPGQPVTWQVGVTSDPPEPGQIELSIRASGPLAQLPSGLQARLDSCPTRWSSAGCAAGATPVLGAGPTSRWLGSSVSAGRLRAGDERWLQVTAWLPAGTVIAPGTASTVTITAVGWGDVIDSGPGGDLPQTGPTASRLVLWLAAGALVAGCGVLVVRRRLTR
ncbi:LPXTG cell wall anchor domain-containing protein, partial [Micropruina sp.]|uniref:LPXTG cell wall anchor domain-containing protein n=1 Tax=Micropruina sp. TaxID=2737536 RepID=UPI0039E72957